MSIKLIAADMDGTLLSSRKQLPKGFFPLVRTLKKIGVRFAPASGRQYYNLYEQFGEIADELMYISENGGYYSTKNPPIQSNRGIYIRSICRIIQ